MRFLRALLLPPLTVAALGAGLLAAACSKPADGRPSSSPAPTAAAKDAKPDPAVARADLARIRGDSTAKVWMLIVSDFQCPYCKTWHDSTAPKIMHDYVDNGKIRVAYMNYPLSMHAFAVPAAEAAMCAGAQSKFWEYSDALFASQARWTAGGDPAPVFDSLATSLKLDRGALKKCMTSHQMRPLIQGDYDRMSAAGTGSTPTFFIGTSTVVGAQPYEAFRPVLDSAIARAAAGTKR